MFKLSAAVKEVRGAFCLLGDAGTKRIRLLPRAQIFNGQACRSEIRLGQIDASTRYVATEILQVIGNLQGGTRSIRQRDAMGIRQTKQRKHQLPDGVCRIPAGFA